VPCYRCGTRQTDPEAGKSSPWRRGVVGEHQVLICPACVSTALSDLARCGRCGSAHLVKRLGQVECLDCRLVTDADPATRDTPRPSAQGGARSTELAAEVARALERVLGR
jgi:hypothetical protein